MNHTELRVDREDLVVSHGPLPWWGGRALARAQVRQIWVREDRSSKGRRNYSLHAVGPVGGPVQLVGGLSKAGRARFLEDWIETQLGLVDVAVPGEHG